MRVFVFTAESHGDRIPFPFASLGSEFSEKASALSTVLEFFRRNRQASHSFSCSSEDCVCNRGRDRWHGGLAESTRYFRALQKIGFHMRGLVHAKDSEVRIAPFLCLAILEMNLSAQCCGHAPSTCAFGLAFNAQRIEREATIHG